MSYNGQLTKKEKGRLKKLRKRGTLVKEGCETSGFTSREDWLEWKRLGEDAEQLPVGPSVRPRKGISDLLSNTTSWPRCEGMDHMYILCRFLFGNNDGTTSSGRKRMRDELSVPRSIPSWATLHNPAAADSVAVIEIQLEHTNGNWNNVLLKLEYIQPLLSSRDARVALPVHTRWFQGDHPRAISDSLLHLPKATKSSKRQKNNEINGTDAASLLSRLILTAEQRVNECFPTTEHVFSQDVGQKAREAMAMAGTDGNSLLPLEAAKDLVKSVRVIENTETSNNDDYVRTLENDRDHARVFSLDCEMVQTTNGTELARITLLCLDQEEPEEETNDVSYKLIMDELVKPYGRVLDYLTEYSGITPKMLENVETRLEQVQAALLCHVGEADIVVGHSLENDLRAVRVVHDAAVDTSVLLRASSGRKYSLRHLSAVLLGKKIQNNGTSGHCSIEDAATALELAVRRAQEGESFCIHERNHDNLLNAIRDETVVCVGPSSWLQQHAGSNSAHALSCSSVNDPNTKAIQAWLTSEKRKAKAVWANLVVDDNDKDIKKLDEILSKMLERISSGTIVLVAFQQGFSRAVQLAKQRQACRDRRSTAVWSNAQEEAFQTLVDQSRSGMAFWIGTM